MSVYCALFSPRQDFFCRFYSRKYIVQLVIVFLSIFIVLPSAVFGMINGGGDAGGGDTSGNLTEASVLVPSSGDWDEDTFNENLELLETYARELVDSNEISEKTWKSMAFSAFVGVSSIPITWFATCNLFGLVQDASPEGVFKYAAANFSVGMLFASSYAATMYSLKDLAINDKMKAREKYKEVVILLSSIFVGILSSIQDGLNARLGSSTVVATLTGQQIEDLDATADYENNLGWVLCVCNILAESSLFGYGLRGIANTYYTAYHHTRYGTLTEYEKKITKEGLAFSNEMLPFLLKSDRDEAEFEAIAQKDNITGSAAGFQQWLQLQKWDPAQSNHLIKELVSLKKYGEQCGTDKQQRSWYLTIRGVIELLTMTGCAGGMAVGLTQLQMTGQQYSLIDDLGVFPNGSAINPNASLPLDAVLPDFEQGQLMLGVSSYVLQSIALATLVNTSFVSANGVLISGLYLLYLKSCHPVAYKRYKNIFKNACSAQEFWQTIGLTLAAFGTAGYVWIADGVYGKLHGVLKASKSVAGNPLIVFPAAKASVAISQAALVAILMNAAKPWYKLQEAVFPKMVDCSREKPNQDENIKMVEPMNKSAKGGANNARVVKRVKRYDDRWDRDRPSRSCLGYLMSGVRWLFDFRKPAVQK